MTFSSKPLILLFLLGVLFQTPVTGQNATSGSASIYDFLTKDEGAKLVLETDLTTLMSERRTAEYLPGTISTPDGKSFPLKIRPRGKFRRKICEVPPLKVKFSKKVLAAAGFNDMNEIKLVIPCFDNNQGDDLIVREYIAYRMFERLSAASFRARLIRLTIKDNHVERTRRQVLCILLEDKEQVCQRLSGVEYEQYGIAPDSLHMNQAALVSLFQYMIGNTDWDVSMMRNLLLMRPTEGGKSYVVPYDFDFSGFVNAPYASPSTESGLKTVRDRFMMADGITPESLRRAAQTIKAAKKDLLDLCKHKFISRDASYDLEQYLTSFFARLDETQELPTVLPMPIDNE